MELYEIRNYISEGNIFEKDIRVNIRKPKIELINLEKEYYTSEEVEEILGINIVRPNDKWPYKALIDVGIRYGIFSKWLKIEKPIYKHSAKFIHIKDLSDYDYRKVLPCICPEDPIIFNIEKWIEENKFCYRRKKLIERLYWIKRLLVENGKDPDSISLRDFESSFTEKELKEYFLLCLDYSHKTRTEIVRKWGYNEWRKINGKFIKRCSQSMFKWEGTGPFIRFKKLPLIGYEEYTNS